MAAARTRRLLSMGPATPSGSRARPKSVLTPEFGVMLGMSVWGVYCALRVLRAKSEFASELLEVEQALTLERTRAEELERENARLLRLLGEAHGTLSEASFFSMGSTSRALRILR